MKERLDVLLVKRNLAASREKAKAIIMSGIVYVDGQKEDKAGTTFPEEATIEVRGHTLPYVSRGGLKLEKAIKNFDVSVEGKVCTDVGSSTGGFTDCMLQNGAVKVFAIDVAADSLTGNSDRIHELYVWKKRTFVMSHRKTLENRYSFHLLMYHLFRLRKCYFRFVIILRKTDR